MAGQLPGRAITAGRHDLFSWRSSNSMNEMTGCGLRLGEHNSHHESQEAKAARPVCIKRPDYVSTCFLISYPMIMKGEARDSPRNDTKLRDRASLFVSFRVISWRVSSSPYSPIRYQTVYLADSKRYD